MFDYQGLLSNPGERELAVAMGQYWSSFAKSHTPVSAAAHVTWPEYSAAADPYLQLDILPNTTAISHLKQTMCDFWASVAAEVMPSSAWTLVR